MTFELLIRDKNRENAPVKQVQRLVKQAEQSSKEVRGDCCLWDSNCNGF